MHRSGCPGLLERQAHAKQSVRITHKAMMQIETEFWTTQTKKELKCASLGQRDTYEVKASGQCAADSLKLKAF